MAEESWMGESKRRGHVTLASHVLATDLQIFVSSRPGKADQHSWPTNIHSLVGVIRRDGLINMIKPSQIILRTSINNLKPFLSAAASGIPSQTISIYPTDF